MRLAKSPIYKELLGFGRAIPGGQTFLRDGGRHIIGHTLPGAILTTGLTTLSTGNPFAGAAVGATDIVLSSLGGRALGSKRLNTGLSGILGRDITKKDDLINLGGTFQAGRLSQKNKKMLPRYYQPSGPQNLAMMTGSVGATIGVEPMFYPEQVQQQQLAQMKYMNGVDPNTSPGTMYQLQGIPYRYA